MSTKKIPTALPVQYRAAKVDAKPKEGERLSGADPGRFSLALTSEEPVARWFGNEILKHDKKSIRTQRLDDGMVPLLFNHDPDQHLGRVDGYSIKDGVLRVEGQFGPSPLAQEKRQDYDAGILNATSGGYRVHKIQRTEDKDNPDAPDRCDVTDWEPIDASLVTVPADPTVGVGRAEEAAKEFPVDFIEVRTAPAAAAPIVEVVNEPTINPKQERAMADQAEVKTPAELEIGRRDAIMALAAEYSKVFSYEDAQRAIGEKSSVDAVKDAIIRKTIDANDAGKVGTLADATFSQASARDQKRYSLVNVVRSLINQHSAGRFSGVDTQFEREMSNELGKRLGKQAEGIYVPLSAFSRALGTQTIAAGAGQLGLTSEAAAVETITRPEVIELLRNRPRVQQLGARTMGGLQGNVRFPRQSAAGTWQWLGEGANVTPSDLAMDFVAVQPRRGSTQSAMDIELMASTSPDLEGLMRLDFNRIRALGIDEASINGPVGGPGPLGVLNATGLATITPTGATMPSGGKALCYADVVDFETTIAEANADSATMGWMLTPATRGLLKLTPKFTNSTGTLIAEPIWKEGPKDPLGLEEGPLGYKAGVTNQMPQNLTAAGVTGNVLHAGIFADWGQMVLCDWGVVEVIYDPYTQAGSGAFVLTMRSMHDVAIRHIAAFCASLKIAVN
jgi:hypothetical protein